MQHALKTSSRKIITCPDSLTMAIAIDENVITETENYNAQFETGDGIFRGQL